MIQNDAYSERFKMVLGVVLIALVMITGLIRPAIPTVIDLSVTAIYKDLAHLVVGAAIGYWMLTRNSAVLMAVLFASMIEVLFAFRIVG